MGEGENDSNKKKTRWGVKEGGVTWTRFKIGLKMEEITKTEVAKD